MGLADDLNSVAKARKGPLCAVGALLSASSPLTDEERDTLIAVMGDPEKQSTSISRVLKAHGHDIGLQSIQRHRRQDCRCDQ